MRRMILLISACLLWGLPVAGDETFSQTSETAAAAQEIGKCLAYQQRRQAVQSELEKMLEAPAARLAAIGAGLAALNRTDAEPAERLRTLRGERAEWHRRIAYQRDLLYGKARPEGKALSRKEVYQELASLQGRLDQVNLLISIHSTEDAWERQRMQARLSFEKLELENQREAIRGPYRARLEAMGADLDERGRELNRALLPFFNRATVGSVTVEALHITCRYPYGLVLVRWNDNRGQLVASAQVNMQAKPHEAHLPPLLAQRYTIFAQDHTNLVAGVGHFEISFRAEAKDLRGQEQILEAVQSLINLHDLAKLVPEAGRGINN